MLKLLLVIAFFINLLVEHHIWALLPVNLGYKPKGNPGITISRRYRHIAMQITRQLGISSSRHSFLIKYFKR